MNARMLIRFLVMFLLIAAFLYLSYIFWIILFPFAVALILHYVLSPAVDQLEQRDIPHSVAVTIVFFVFFLGVTGLLFLLIPALAGEFAQIQDNIPYYSTTIMDKISSLESFVLNLAPGFTSGLSEKNIDAYVKSSLVAFGMKLASMIISLLPLVLNIIIIPFATFFFLLDAYRIKSWFISIVPNRSFEFTLSLLHRINVQFGYLLSGFSLDIAIMSVLISFCLWLIGLDYPIIVGVFSGFANLIPYAGPVVGIIVSIFVALITDAPNMMYVYIVIVFLAVNLFENIVVQPLVMSRAANLHPLLIIFLILLGSRIGGVFGMFLAVPVASLVNVFFSILFSELSRPVRPPFNQYIDRDRSSA